MTASAAVKIDKTNYKGWPTATDFKRRSRTGAHQRHRPRIMRYGLWEAKIYSKNSPWPGKSGEAVWQLRGGHRIWVGRRNRERTYAPDNGPVRVSSRRCAGSDEPVEPLTGLEKQIVVKLSPTGSAVE